MQISLVMEWSDIMCKNNFVSPLPPKGLYALMRTE